MYPRPWSAFPLSSKERSSASLPRSPKQKAGQKAAPTLLRAGSNCYKAGNRRPVPRQVGIDDTRAFPSADSSCEQWSHSHVAALPLILTPFLRKDGTAAPCCGTPAAVARPICFYSSQTRKPGESANAVPHYHKLCSRVSHIWGNRRGQHIRSAMDKPRPGKTTFVIMVSPLPGKYELTSLRGTTPSDSNHSTVRTTFLMRSLPFPF